MNTRFAAAPRRTWPSAPTRRVCARRWREAFEAGFAPPVVMECTHVAALEFVPLEWLLQHALPTREARDA